MSLIIKKVEVGPLATNCYIVSCEVTGHTFIIDPGDNPKVIVDYIFRNELVPKSIILTHGHYDHIGAVKAILGELNVNLMIHSADKPMLAFSRIKEVDKYLIDKEILELGREKFNVIHTPGHTAGSVCIYRTGILFSGDTLFKDGVGRTDLPGGSYEDLENSLKNKLFLLPLDTIVYPGHGPETTIGEEMQ